MAVNSSATVIIDVELQGEDARKESDAIGVSIAKLRDVQKELAKENKKTSTTYVENQQKIAALNREQKAYISIANASTGSNNQLRAQLSLLTAQYNALSKEERENSIAGKALTIQTRSLSDEIKKNDQNVGDNRRSVGDYTESINRSVVGQLPFLNNLTLIKDAFGALTGVIQEVKAVQLANTTATELNTAATEAQTASQTAQTTAQEASISATEANTTAQNLATEAELLRAEADKQRIILENQLVASEEREAAILAQLAAEQQAIVAEEQLRIANEQALLASQSELVAAEEARVAVEVELAAATTAQAASEAAASAATQARGSALKLTGAAIIAVVLAVGAAALSFARQMDGFSDSIDQDLERVKRGFREYGATIVDAVTGKGWKAFEGLKQRVKDATDAGAHFVEVFQNLGDLTEVNDLANQVTQNEVANLRLQARNRKLSNDQKQKLLDDADAMERNQFIKTQGLHSTIIAESVQFAETSLRTTNKFTEEQRKQLEAGNLQLANNLLNANKISKDAYKKLQEAYVLRNSDLASANQQAEKIQNDKDKYDEKAKAETDKRQGELDKINDDRIKSELATAQTLLTVRQVDAQNINADIDKRVKLYQKYGQDTEQLEIERQSRLTVLNNKFQQEDLKTIRTNLNEATSLRISLIADNEQRTFEQQQFANQNQIAETDRNIMALAARIALGEQGLTAVIQSEFEKRNALSEVGDQERINRASDLSTQLQQIELAGSNASFQAQADELQRAQDLNQQRIDVNDQLTKSYSDLVGTIGDLTGKQTVFGKIAFLAQKAFAIQQIILNAELTKSQIILRYEVLKLQATQAAALAGPFAPFAAAAAIAGLSAAEGVEIAKATASEIVQVAIVGATAIGGVVGKAKGGIQDYTSDGKGGVLKGYATKDDTNAYLRSGEAVVVSEAAKDPSTRRLLSDINVAYGGNPYPGLALGGIYGGSGLQQTNSDITGQVFQQNKLNEAIGRLKIYTAITDVREADANYTKLIDAATF